MNWDALGAIGEIVGAIGVIATLGYLAIQVRENSRQVRSNSVVAINHLINEGFDPIYNSERDQRIYITGTSRPHELKQEELQIYYLFVVRLINSFATALTQHRNGVLDDADFERYRNALALTLSQPGFKQWFSEVGELILDEQLKDFLRPMINTNFDDDT